MTSEGLGEMFEGDSADVCAGKFPLVLMGGWVEGLACVDPEARSPIGASGNLLNPIHKASWVGVFVYFINVYWLLAHTWLSVWLAFHFLPQTVGAFHSGIQGRKGRLGDFAVNLVDLVTSTKLGYQGLHTCGCNLLEWLDVAVNYFCCLLLTGRWHFLFHAV